MPKTPKSCVECGGDAIAHELTYTSLVIDEIMRPLIAPGPILRRVGYMFDPLERAFTPLFFKFFLVTKMAREVHEKDEHTMLLSEVLWDEAKERGIRMREVRIFNLPRNLYLATYPNGRTIAFEGIPDPKGGNRRVWWMDNKAQLKKHFSKLGLPVAAGGSAPTLAIAKTIYSQIEPPVITKPYEGSASRHTTLHIDTEEELERGFRVAKQVAPFVIVEEELVGAVYRATVVNGKLEATLRRDPPHVIGDGTHTIKELVEKANEHPARSGPYFSKMKLDEAALQELAWHGYTPDTVLPKGTKTFLHQKVNWGLGGTTADVSDEVHPDNVALFEEAAKVLKTPIVGIDFIIGDISKSWKEQPRCGILECNSMPFFDNHHLPFEGQPRNVAAAIWDMVS